MTATSHVARVFNDRAPQRKKLLVFTRDGHPEDAALLSALEGSFDIAAYPMAEATTHMHSFSNLCAPSINASGSNPFRSDYAAIVCFGEPTNEFTEHGNPLQVFLRGLGSLQPQLRNRPILLVGENRTHTRAEQNQHRIIPTDTEAAQTAVAWLTARLQTQRGVAQ